MSRPALVIMARAPVPGQVKTRLQTHLTSDECASLYLAFLRDLISLAASIREFETFIAFTPSESETFFRSLTTEEVKLVLQTGHDLGERMFNAMMQLEERGYSGVVVIGSDLPTIQPGTLKRAIECLGKSDLCLGPAVDGGYYLIAARHINSSLFQDIPWSTSTVFNKTVEKAKAAGLSVTLLDEYSDVDTFDDLERLARTIDALKCVSGSVVPQFTEAWLRKWETLE